MRGAETKIKQQWKGSHTFTKWTIGNKSRFTSTDVRPTSIITVSGVTARVELQGTFIKICSWEKRARYFILAFTYAELMNCLRDVPIT